MAKGKRAVALFEVIHKDKRFDRKSAPPPEPPRVDDSRTLAKQAVDLWRKKNSDPETWTQPGPTLKESFAAFTARVSALRTKMHSAYTSSMNFLRLRISQTNGIIPGIGAAAIVIFAMLAARHFFHPAVPVPTIEESLRSEPPHPTVLTIGSRAVPSPAVTPETTSGLSPEILLDEQQASQKTIPNLAQPGQRVVNLHYVLMQSYFEEKTAKDACDFLNQAGIPCTIERGIKGWRPDFYQVIGLQGFVRPSGPQYVAYRHHIEDLGEKFSPKSRYKRFQPQAIKW